MNTKTLGRVSAATILALTVGLIPADLEAQTLRGRAAARNTTGGHTQIRRPAGASSAPAVSAAIGAIDEAESPAGGTLSGATIVASAIADSEAVVNEILSRYSVSYSKANKFCGNLSGKLDSLKVMAGISTAASGVGTLAAGTALITGAAKSVKDKQIGKIQGEMAERNAASPEMREYDILDGTKGYEVNKYTDSGLTTDEGEPIITRHGQSTPESMIDKDRAIKAAEDFLKMTQSQRDALDVEELLYAAYGMKMMNEQDQAKIDGLAKKSQGLGTARTVTSFVAGGTSAAAATFSFIGAAQIDDLIKEMNACDSYVREIKSERGELLAEGLGEGHSTIKEMTQIISDCSGFNSGNISNIKSKFMATGIISAVGTATGVAGGITSAIAGSKEKAGASATASVSNRDCRPEDGPTCRDKSGTKELNTASNILAGVTTATSATSTMLSATMIFSLKKNSDIADRCKRAL